MGLLEMLSVSRQSYRTPVHQHHVHKPGFWTMEWTSQIDRKLQHTTAEMQTLQTSAFDRRLKQARLKRRSPFGMNIQDEMHAGDH